MKWKWILRYFHDMFDITNLRNDMKFIKCNVIQLEHKTFNFSVLLTPRNTCKYDTLYETLLHRFRISVKNSICSIHKNVRIFTWIGSVFLWSQIFIQFIWQWYSRLYLNCGNRNSVGWNYLSIPKLQHLSLGSDKLFNHTIYCGRSYLSMPELKLICVSENSPCLQRWSLGIDK